MPMRTPEAQRAYQREWVARRRAEFFANKVCVICESTDRLQLHHLDRDRKISHNVWSWSVERRDAEIAKCVVLCYDCHQGQHRAERQAATRFRNRTMPRDEYGHLTSDTAAA